MAVMIGNARISERGTVSGSRGDQTGKEVMQQTWSTGGVWTYVIRPKSESVAKKIAQAMIDACNNNNIGYSQTDRLSLYNLASKNGFKLNKVGACNTDCSALVSVCVNAAGVKVASTMYTGNELALLKATGKFDVFTGWEYTHSEKKLRTGDILLRQGHTAVVTNGVVPFSSETKKADEKSTQKKETNKTTKKNDTKNTTSTTTKNKTSLNKTPKWAGKVTANKLNVRSWAGTENKNIKAYPYLYKNNMVDVCDTLKDSKGNKWYYIKIAKKYYGFVSSAYIKKA